MQPVQNLNQKQFIQFLNKDMKRMEPHERRPTVEDWDALVQEGFFHQPPYYKNEMNEALKTWRQCRAYHRS